MSRERYTVKCLSSGQSRPYADSVYTYEVLVEWQGIAGYTDKSADAPYIPRPELSKEIVMPILRALTRGWDDDPGAFGRRLARCEMTEPGLWLVQIVEPFTD